MRSLIVFLVLVPKLSWGTVIQTVPQVLEKICPKSQTQKKNAYLTKDQIQAINVKLESKLEEKSTLVTYFECYANNLPIAYAYIDVHRVRKESETLLIAVDVAGDIRNVEVLQFGEPKEYIPGDLWKQQFYGKDISDMKNSKLAIVAITGATLTSRSVTKSVQKILAIHQLLQGK